MVRLSAVVSLIIIDQISTKREKLGEEQSIPCPQHAEQEVV